MTPDQQAAVFMAAPFLVLTLAWLFGLALLSASERRELAKVRATKKEARHGN